MATKILQSSEFDEESAVKTSGALEYDRFLVPKSFESFFRVACLTQVGVAKSHEEV